jgi:hypothetical protein
LLALTLDERLVAAVSIILAGSLLGFLRFNTYPARIFMGDGGSQFLGFTVAVLAILITQHESLPISAALPLLLLGLPILDTLSVMAQRLAEGRSPFAADKNHVHHRLLALGFAHYEAVFIIYLTQACLFVFAWYLRYTSDVAIVAVFAGFAVVTLGLLHLGAKYGWRWRMGPAGAETDGSARPGWWRALRQRMPAWTLAVADGDGRRPKEALELARQASRSAGRPDARVSEVLAAALAANGRYEEAVTAASDALRLLPDGSDPQQRASMERRLALYRQGKPFVADLR